jgi:hypothetical protein
MPNRTLPVRAFLICQLALAVLAHAIVRYIGTLSYWKDPQRRHERAILKAAGVPNADL